MMDKTEREITERQYRSRSMLAEIISLLHDLPDEAVPEVSAKIEQALASARASVKFLSRNGLAKTKH